MATSKQKNLSEQAENLTVHGVSRVVNAKTKIGKAIWLLLCIAAFCFLVKFAVRSLIKHFQRKVSVDVQKTNLEKIPLPAITFCNKNIFAGIPAPTMQKLPDNCSMIQDKYFKNKVNKEYFKMACELFFGNISQTSSSIAYYPRDYLRFPKHFSLLPSYSPCFTLNRNSTLNQFIARESSGLHMILNFDEEKYTRQSFDVVADPRQGLSVIVHEPKVHYPNSEGKSVSPGYYTQFKIKKVVKQRKPKPFPSDCVHKEEDKCPKIFSGKQTKDLCLQTCFLLKMYEVCGDVLDYYRPFLPLDEYPKQSWHMEAEPCYEKLSKLYRANNCNCRLPCYEELYEVDTSHSPWPQKWQAKYYSQMLAERLGVKNRSFSFEEIKKRLIKVSFYYENLVVETHTERERYTFESIVSDFGGQMGLFLGASVLSLVEVFLLACNGLMALFNKKRNSASGDVTEST